MTERDETVYRIAVALDRICDQEGTIWRGQQQAGALQRATKALAPLVAHALDAAIEAAGNADEREERDAPLGYRTLGLAAGLAALEGKTK